MSVAPSKRQKSRASTKGKGRDTTPIELSETESIPEQGLSKSQKKSSTRVKDPGVPFVAEPPPFTPIVARQVSWYECTPEELVSVSFLLSIPVSNVYLF